MPYLGNEPAAAFTSTTKDTFSGDASTTDFTMSKSANVNAVRVVVENVVQDPGVAYTCTGTTLSFTSAPPTGTNNIYVVHLGPPAATVAPPTTINNPTTYAADLTIADGADLITASAGTDNVRLGDGAGAAIVSGGNQNVLIGKDAGTAITTGDDNVAIGHQALDANTTGIKNVSVGSSALTSNVTGNDNTAVGHQALQANTANDNTAVGWGALYTNTSAAGNTAVGRKSLYSNTTGNENIAMGYQAGEENTTGSGNTLLGYQAGNKITSGNHNTAVGGNALDALTTGGANTAVGREALTKVTTGSQNTALGLEAGKEITTGTFNVAVGWSALKSVAAGDHNVAVGSYSQFNSVGEYNTSLGQESMINATSGDYNTALGYKAAEDMTASSDKNTFVGAFSGGDLTNGAELNFFGGYNTDTYSGGSDNQIVIGSDVTSVGGGYITFGTNSGGRVYNHPYSNATWTHTSDERIKKDIQTNTDCGLDFINDLRTVTYKWKAPSEHPEEFVSYNADKTEAAHTEKMYGFIAQEVKAAMDTHNITDFAGWHTVAGNGDQQGISYEMFVMPLVKAVQELSAKNDALETENTAIKARLDALEAG